MMSLSLKIVGVFILASASSVCGLICWECENVYSQQECLEKGRETVCEPTQDTCQLTLRHGGWGDRPLIEKACKQLKACGSNHIQDSHSASVFARDSQCNMKPPSSVCRCCCSTDLCTQNNLFCENFQIGGLPCPALQAPTNGRIYVESNFEVLSGVLFDCDEGYNLVGPYQLTCGLFSKWDKEPPTCEPVRCPSLEPYEFGNITCTNRNNLGSYCSFSCEVGYRLQGISAEDYFPWSPVVCQHNIRIQDSIGVWNHPVPRCVPLQCEAQSLRNGRVSCTDRNFVGSDCRFSCRTSVGYELYPPASIQNTCQRNEEWTIPQPCCTLPCPPFAVMDFVAILDSSSSVGSNNWIRMAEFVRGFLDDFVVRNDSSHFAIFRYNRDVDSDTQILFNSYPDNVDDVLAAFDRIPYNGSGTRTGNALNYTVDNILPRGNRPEARDIVLLITDGASQDDVVVPSQRLRDTGALVLVLPVLPPVGRLDLDEIAAIAGPGNEANIITQALEGGFEALDEDLTRDISRLLCGDPCANA